MNEDDFDRLWSDRAARYPNSTAGTTDQTVHIHVDPVYAETYAGQVAAITAASLFGRMRRNVAVHVPSLSVVAPLPWPRVGLDDLVMRHARRRAQVRPVREALCVPRRSTPSGRSCRRGAHHAREWLGRILRQ